MSYANHIIKGQFYKGIKEKWSFSYHSLVKFDGKKNWDTKNGTCIG